MLIDTEVITVHSYGDEIDDSIAKLSGVDTKIILLPDNSEQQELIKSKDDEKLFFAMREGKWKLMFTSNSEFAIISTLKLVCTLNKTDKVRVYF